MGFGNFMGYVIAGVATVVKEKTQEAAGQKAPPPTIAQRVEKKVQKEGGRLARLAERLSRGVDRLFGSEDVADD